ncbi:uncharacterized protein PV07_06438 [Cladophialophora immunda]|uniref:Uncharacterized protein n=1 Tax=Cladophialophora immunda TaxID=569365 RepID=A0A0D2CSP1_9EURO|nr:uncharacterized protein PV07_06438 [Cladophialophora immunda]KIW26619.1 hypothetical protein PV07_06438 [Cladophialophora immunda]OQV07395.1 hypothetical protein CLAIMM_11838 [Cladophialophora immunda]
MLDKARTSNKGSKRDAQGMCPSSLRLPAPSAKGPKPLHPPHFSSEARDWLDREANLFSPRPPNLLTRSIWRASLALPMIPNECPQARTMSNKLSRPHRTAGAGVSPGETLTRPCPHASHTIPSMHIKQFASFLAQILALLPSLSTNRG